MAVTELSTPVFPAPEVRLQSAKRNLERARQTFDQGLLNKVDYERAQDDVQLAEVELKTARDAKGLGRETAEFEIQTQHLARARQVHGRAHKSQC